MESRWALMFSNPQLENIFARATRGEKEKGGWLFVSWEPFCWPGRLNTTKLRKSLSLPQGAWSPSPRFITGFVLAPNEDESPETQYSVWDWKKSWAIAKATAKAFYATVIHFHTHPNGGQAPSSADLGFAGAECEFWPGYAEFAIVTARPMRVSLYTLDYGNVADPGKGQLVRQPFWTWHMKALKEAVI